MSEGISKDHEGWVEKARDLALRECGFVLLLAGFGILFYQVIFYLMVGHWPGFPLLTLAQFAPEELVSWLDKPDSWIGLQKIVLGTLEFVPLSGFLVIVGLSMCFHDQ